MMHAHEPQDCGAAQQLRVGATTGLADSASGQESFEIRFASAYADVLTQAIQDNPQDYAYPATKAPQVVEKMIAMIKKGGRSDWLKYNKAMRDAAKRCCIRTSKELRQALGAE